MTLQTSLYDWHVAQNGRMVDFAGWKMPIQYTSIVEEHHAVRRAAGLFDISHMGRLNFVGPQASALINHLVTIDVDKMKVGQVRYALVCNEQAGILDDVLVYRLPETWWMVVNASNREKILAWIATHQASFDAQVEDKTFDLGMIALQGPEALTVMNTFVGSIAANLKYYQVAEGWFFDEPALISRTGYTGEDGFEIILHAGLLSSVCEDFLAMGGPAGLKPCGLGCRDTLRLEAAMPLYGHELNETIDPLTAGLAFAVKLDKSGFLGQAALKEIATKTDRPVRVGLELEGRRIAREGASVLANQQSIGHVTSGTFSPTLERAIAMGYLAPEYATPGTPLQIDIRGTAVNATVTPLPFYKRD